MSFTHPPACSSFHTKCKHGAPSPLITSALHTPRPPPPSPPSTSPAFPSLPSSGRRCQPSRRADVSACLLWYSSIRFAWSPRSGTNNLFNPLIIIRGINKFGMGGCTLNLEPTPWAEIYLFAIFPPVAWWQKVSLPQPLYLSPLCPERAMNPLSEWDGCCLSTYAIFRETASVLTNISVRDTVRCIGVPIKRYNM